MSDDLREKYSVALTVQEWDLVVLSLGYVFERAEIPSINSAIWDLTYPIARKDGVGCAHSPS